jgi:hypothetical protein
MPLPQTSLERLAEVFDELKIDYLAGGSVASSIHGAARSTMDTDIPADLRADGAEALAGALEGEFIAFTEDILSALASPGRST